MSDREEVPWGKGEKEGEEARWKEPEIQGLKAEEKDLVPFV